MLAEWEFKTEHVSISFNNHSNSYKMDARDFVKKSYLRKLKTYKLENLKWRTKKEKVKGEVENYSSSLSKYLQKLF